jgi:SPP1 Gp6-like portal protein
MEEPKSDVQRAFETLAAKKAAYDILWNYYDGVAPVKYVVERLREVFGHKTARFTENFAAVIVDSFLERISLKEFDIADETAEITPDAGEDIEPSVNPLQARLNDLFAQTELNLDASDVHTAALVTGEGFVFAWVDEEVGLEAYCNDPRLCHIFYDEEHPRIKQFGAKWWVGEDELLYLNLYYPDHIEYYRSDKKAENVSAYTSLVKQPDEPNPFGVIPIFHFRRERRVIKSVFANAIEPMDAINKLFQDMMVAAEFGTFKQRWAVTAADMTALKSAPNEVWKVPIGDGEGESTQVGEFSATELDNYLKAMSHLANDIAIIERLPKHYFFGQGGDPSGEALIALEAPLNKKVAATISRFSPTWAEVASFLLQLDGAIVPKEAIVPVFEPPETIQPRTQAEIRQIDVNAGIPLVTSLRMSGWTEEEIKAMEDDKQAQQEQQNEAQLNQADEMSALAMAKKAMAVGATNGNGATGA